MQYDQEITSDTTGKQVINICSGSRFCGSMVLIIIVSDTHDTGNQVWDQDYVTNRTHNNCNRIEFFTLMVIGTLSHSIIINLFHKSRTH